MGRVSLPTGMESDLFLYVGPWQICLDVQHVITILSPNQHGARNQLRGDEWGGISFLTIIKSAPMRLQ